MVRWSWRLALLPALGLLACATVPPGHAAVVTRPLAGVDAGPLRDGSFWVGPLASVDLVDLRQQERDDNFVALLGDGALVRAGASLVTYRYAPDEVVALVREIGPDAYPAISPVIQSAVRRVLASLRLEDLDTAHLRAAQVEITRIARQELRPLHVLLESVDLREVDPVAPAIARAAGETGVLEQQVLRAPDDLRLAQQRAARRKVEGAGIAASNAALAGSLDGPALDDLRSRAWTRLLAAPGTRTVVLHHAIPWLEVSP